MNRYIYLNYYYIKYFNPIEENDIIINDLNNLLDIIKSDDFYYTDDVLNIIYPKKDYIYYSDYIKLKEYSDAKLPINSIQHFTNKLFEQNNDSYYYYFSFGTLKNIELINWHFSLKPYVQNIKNMVYHDVTLIKSIQPTFFNIVYRK